jgi:hypothetical protein
VPEADICDFLPKKVTAGARSQGACPASRISRLPEKGQAMSTAHAVAPLTHEAFRQRQEAAQPDGLSYKSVRVAWTDLGKGEPVILLHGIPTWSFLYNEVIPLLAPRIIDLI